MARKNRRLDIDYSKPVDVSQFKLDEGDCFGKEWSPQHLECIRCHASPSCAILHGKANNNASKGFYLDTVDFSLVPENKLIKVVKNRKIVPTDDLISVVTKLSKCPDPESVKFWVYNFIKRNNFKLDGKSIISN